jgi:hypothetical protein
MKEIRNESNIIFVKNYLNLIIVYGVLDFTLGIFSVFLGERTIFISVMLSLRLFLDILLILFNLKNLRFKSIEIFLISILFLNLILGLFYFPLGRRHFTDFVNPLMFILKIISFRIYFLTMYNYRNFNNYISKFSKIMFWAGIIGVIELYILISIMPAYLGATPIIYPYLIKGLLEMDFSTILFSIIAVFFAGKRAMLIGVIVVIFVYYGLIRKKLKSIILFFILFFSLLSSLYISYKEKIEENPAVSKYKYTIDELSSDNFAYNNLDLINIVSGGRISEIEGAFKYFDTPFDFAFGQGAGFTYRWYQVDGLDFEDYHSNVHFTPAGIVSKYGFFFFLFLFIYIFDTLRKTRISVKRYDFLSIFFYLYVIGALIDSFFAYTLFIEILLPIALGYLQAKNIKQDNFEFFD